MNTHVFRFKADLLYYSTNTRKYKNNSPPLKFELGHLEQPVLHQSYSIDFSQ